MKYIYNFKLFETKVKKSDKVDIFRNDKYIVVRPLTHKASCKYGAFTKWCISAPDAQYVFDSNKEAIVIFIIQKDYKISPDKEKFVYELIRLNDLEQERDLSDRELKKLSTLMMNHKGEDLSKIALIFNHKDLKNPEIWDKNNICLSDPYKIGYYSYMDLPIDKHVLDEIEKYISDINQKN